MARASAQQPVFYYDLASPTCYLAAERVTAGLPVVAEWEPVLGAELGTAEREVDRVTIERLGGAQCVQPLRWPREWPPDPSFAALTATYAKQIGRVVAFSLACFRQVFAGGRDLGDENTVLLAAAASEMHPAAVLNAIRLRSVSDALGRATARARAAGIAALPAIEVGEHVYAGADAVELAAEALGAPA